MVREARWGIGAAVVGSRALFYDRAEGPYGPATDLVDIYDSAAQRWSTARLSQARTGLVVAAAGTRVIFAGGATDGQCSDRVDIYDTSAPPATGGS